MSTTFNESQNQLNLLQHVESIEEILSRDHEPHEIQEKVHELMKVMERGDFNAKRKIEMALLDQARSRIKLLLAHKNLETNSNVSTKITLERIQSMLHPMRVLARMYDYKPNSETTDRIELGIDWSATDKIINSSDFRHFDSINGNTEGVNHRNSRAAKFTEKTLFQTNLNCSQSKPLNLEGYKMIREDKISRTTEDFFVLKLMNPNFPEEDYIHSYVGNFVFRKTDRDEVTEWNMGDRIVSEAYRSQGIAPKMLEMTEEMIKQYGQERNKPQVIKAEVGQVNVLVWLLKHGYIPENEEDREKIEKLFNGDESLMLASAPNDSQAEEKRQWYIFEKNSLLDEQGQQKPEVWDNENYGQLIHYMKSSFRINLKKEL